MNPEYLAEEQDQQPAYYLSFYENESSMALNYFVQLKYQRMEYYVRNITDTDEERG